MFKQDFKYYKSKKPPPSYENVLDFDSENILHKVIKRERITTNSSLFGLIPTEEWEIYDIKENPGLVFIKNPFTRLGQRYWITRCLKSYPETPNKTNLDIHDLIPHNETWWESSKGDNEMLKKLRWATFGYHHNWDTKIYSENSKSIFPKDLYFFTKHFAETLSFNLFNPEAAIVNYYHLDSTLSGHTDHSENNLEAPLFSFSFGQTALFLIGGESIDVKPTALYLKSGDVIIMSKKSRLCYHGVPKILNCVNKSWNLNENFDKDELIEDFIDKNVLNLCCDNDKWERFNNYINNSRININIRQVLRKGEIKVNK
nr:nucleic acid dioxygenase ALKBH1 [Onthophagus taurus]